MFIIDFEELYQIQAGLKKHIELEKPAKDDKEKRERIKKKGLAILVELGEAANETKCFKFWSDKHGQATEHVNEECMDYFHFLLEFGIDHGFRVYEPQQIRFQNLTDQFLTLYQYTVKAIFAETIKEKEHHYYYMFDLFFGLMDLLGISDETIYKEYMKKNQINHRRQQNGY